jgi:hypothetical protein
MKNRVRWIEVGVVMAAFGVVAGGIELTGAPRELVLPTWMGVTLALAAYGDRRGTWLPRSLVR